MHFMEFKFLPPDIDRSLALSGSYNFGLVVLSVIAAVMASYIAFLILQILIYSKNEKSKIKWLCLGSIAMGSGIWTMHFLGMVAFSLPVKVDYNLGATLVSMVPSIVASGITLAFLKRKMGRTLSFWELNLAGLIMGLGIGTMHYTGMAAMMMDARMYYDPVLFYLSIIVAHILATIAIFIKLNIKKVGMKTSATQRRFVGALVMGCAVSGMHYTAMKATYYFPQAKCDVQALRQGMSLDPVLLGILVSVGTLLLMGSVLAVIWFPEFDEESSYD